MYRLHRSGGRVESAGLGLDLLYPEAARLYAEDPFLKLLSPELTTSRRVPVRGKQLERLLQTIRSRGQMNARSYHAFHRGIERSYHHGGTRWTSGSAARRNVGVSIVAPFKPLRQRHASWRGLRFTAKND